MKNNSYLLKNNLQDTTDNADYLINFHYSASSNINRPFLFFKNINFTDYNSELTENYNSGMNITDFLISQKLEDTGMLRLNFFTNASVKYQDNKEMITTTEQENKIYKNHNIIKNTDTNWILGIILVGLIIIALLKYLYKNKIVETLTSGIIYKTSVNYYKDFLKNPNKSGVYLNLLFYLNSSVLLFTVLDFYQATVLNVNDFVFTLTISGFLLLVVYLHKFAIFILGNIFYLKPYATEYNFNISNYNKIIGLLMIPILTAYTLIPAIDTFYTIYSAIILIAIIQILRTFRLFQIFFNKGVSFLYLFLYLCTLEIIPVMLIFKIIKSLSINNL